MVFYFHSSPVLLIILKWKALALGHKVISRILLLCAIPQVFWLVLPIELIHQELCKNPAQVWGVYPIGMQSHIFYQTFPLIYKAHVFFIFSPLLCTSWPSSKAFHRAARAKIYKDERKPWQRYFFSPTHFCLAEKKPLLMPCNSAFLFIHTE